MRSLLLFFVLTCACTMQSAARDDELRKAFPRPPDSVRPWVYWMWMDGNLTREGITADLESMKQAGIGGAVICEVSVGVPRGKVLFMSPEWRQLFKHMVRKARRLGLQITMNAGPGWTGSGGPWVKPEASMQHIVASETTVTGPVRFASVIRPPSRRPAFFGDGQLPPDLERAKDDFLRDVAVLAFPTPASVRMISDIDEKALYVRAPYSSQPDVRSTFSSPANHPSLPGESLVMPDQVIDLSDRLGPDGRITWQIPAGRWTIMRFGRTSTGATTRPAPVPGLGLECDKLDTSALNAHFDAFVGTLLREIGEHKSPDGSGWAYLHIDSWEMGAQNWTAAFRSEFLRRRGYDITPYLPVVAGRPVSSLETSERFLWDLRQTVQELILENHAGHLKRLATRTGFGLSIEPYDMTPCADMSLGGVAEVPMCEFWLYGFNTSYSVIEAVSVAHTMGLPVVAAEAFTSSDEERWQAHPGSMKSLGDWAFCAGVNRIVFHRFQHQPWSRWKPGMTMGPYGVHWDRTQTWWDMVPAYHAYLSRCQLLLRQGLPVADVCFLVAEGAPHVFTPPPSATSGNPPDRRGHNFDGCSPEALLARASVSDGLLRFPDGMTYRVLVLPERETMTLPLLKKIRSLVSDGLTVVGLPPVKSPGLSGYPECDRVINELALELWGDCDGERITEHRYGKGKVVWFRQPPSDNQYADFRFVERLLRRMNVVPDFESDAPVRYTHRTAGTSELYFLANRENRPVDAECLFRVASGYAELWDPVNGTITSLPPPRHADGRSNLKLRFEPHQSFFIVFERGAGRPDPTAHRKDVVANAADIRHLATLEGSWQVQFDTKWGGPGRVVFNGLQDWTHRPEDGIRYYSGAATYLKRFDLPAALKGASGGGRLLLDLGVVREMASVRLNGRDLGVLWCPPARLDITEIARQTGNSLEITVANLWPNRLIGDEQLPPDCEYGKDGNLLQWPEWFMNNDARPSRGRYTFTTWQHFSNKSPLLPSGLIGPVRILRSDE